MGRKMSHNTLHATIAATDVSFDCNPAQSVLDNALAAGIELPYSCRKGVCGSCAGRVASGEVTGLHGGPVRNDTCADDEVLYCLCAAASDIVLAPHGWKRIDPGARKKIAAKVYSNHLAASDVSVLRLRFPAGQKVKFAAGQYLQVRMEDGSSRSYSMANPPHENDGAILHIRHVQDGVFSARVAGLAPGDVLEIEMPFGHVHLPEDDLRPIVFVAGGTGFAPVKAIIDDLMRKRAKRQVTLIWGARNAAGLYMLAAIDRWRRQWPDFRFLPAISDDPAADIADAFAGRADQALQASCPNLQDHVVYCCGSPGMVTAVRQAALASGAQPDDFHADAFVPGPAG